MGTVPLPAAAVFDNDGLLLDTEQAWTRAEVALFERHGGTFTPALKRRLIGSSGADAAALLERWLDLPGRGPALMDELHELVMEEARGPVAARPGALELVGLLKAAGVPLALASNSPRAFVERVLASAGLADAPPFDVVLTADDVDRPKPAPDLYLAACAALGQAPADCVGLEDSPPGVAAASAAGLFVVGVPYFPDSELDGVDLLAGSLADDAVRAALGLRVAAR